jgi:hypothetical protein
MKALTEATRARTPIIWFCAYPFVLLRGVILGALRISDAAGRVEGDSAVARGNPELALRPTSARSAHAGNGATILEVDAALAGQRCGNPAPEWPAQKGTRL